MASFLGLARILLLSLLVSVVVADDYACTNPKVRREWRALSTSERGDWIKAVNCLSALPHTSALAPVVPVNQSVIGPINPNSSFYDDLVYVHMDLNTRIHFSAPFLPWHRQYLYYFESALIEKCGYTGSTPYWDWTLDAADFYNSDFWDTSSNGVGGWGDPNNDFQIYDGGFKDVVRVYPSPHHIRRNYSLFPMSNPRLIPPWGFDPLAPPLNASYMINTTMTKENVDYVTSNYEGNYMAFQGYFESTSGVHLGAHLIVGGDMAGFCPSVSPGCVYGTKWTPNDPTFFLHHGMIDKMWYDWQHKSPKNAIAYGGGSVQAADSFADFIKFPTGFPPYDGYDSLLPGDGLWNNVTVWDRMDTKSGGLCYTYA